jgi:hypothetical protein
MLALERKASKYLLVIQKFSWAYDLENKSSWHAFIIVKKDGEMLE